jgi:hypothetical protein
MGQGLEGLRGDQETVDQIIKRVRKLRWMGLEDEARRVLETLPQQKSKDVIVPEPSETD